MFLTTPFNRVLAVDPETGKEKWSFDPKVNLHVHYSEGLDTAAQPVLGVLRREGNETPVVIQGNKTGNLFVLNLETGKPIFGVEERSVPRSDTESEDASPTQPFPSAPPALARQQLTTNDAWGINADEREACRVQMEKLKSDGVLTAPSVQGSIAFPGNLGGMKWSSGAFDQK